MLKMEKLKRAKKKSYKNVSVCRACLTASPNLTSLTSVVEANGLTINEMLQNIYPCQVASAHISQICAMCLSLLKIAHDFKVQLEQSEKVLRERDGNSVDLPNKSDEEIVFNEIEIKEESAEEPKGVVELIYGNDKYDLKNVVIVEEEPDVTAEHNYAGFLSNLGSEISAEFVKVKAEHVAEIAKEEISIFVNMPESNDESNGPLETAVISENDPVVEKTTVAPVKKKKVLSYQCEICGFIANSKSSQRYHSLKHKTPRFHCQICPGKSFLLGYKLTDHMRTYHKGEKPFLCPTCGKGFPHHSSLAYHLKVHNGEKNFNCKVCGDKFYLSGNLLRHMLTHTKERPHKCRFCDKSFPVKNQRTLHENTHLNIKPHQCKYCGKNFNRLSNLKYHHMTHSGTFSCTLCSRSFMEAKFLTTHLKKTHHIADEVVTTEEQFDSDQ